ncbi:hypothetical protein EIP86_003192 [Pleurotus ostreatoroseus]|nr:hypothetical protein EIP86_003192 [Pleurotus ostreatoroseus]
MTQQLRAKMNPTSERSSLSFARDVEHQLHLLNSSEWDAPSAFLTVKPDMDVFGVPKRTRTQRGWYQVKPWPPRPSTERTREEQRQSPVATAADIPPELFDNVLNSTALQLSGYGSITKQQLGYICLVCRRWNRVVQPRMFRCVTLRNRADVDMLHAIVFTSPRPVYRAIRDIRLSLDLKKYPYHPWLHLFVWSRVLDKVILNEPSQLVVMVDIKGPLPKGRYIKGIHDLLPSRLPSMSLGITYLRLCNVRFKIFSVLLHFLRELPSVKDVALTEVDWENSSGGYVSSPALHYFFRRAQHRSYNVTYRLQRCADNSAAAWLCALLPLDKRELLEQTHADFACLVGSALTQNIDTKIHPDWKMRSARYVGSDPIEFVAESGYKQITPFLKIYYRQRWHGERCHVYAITCAFTSREQLPLTQTIGIPNWSLIDALASSFSDFEAFVVDFKSPEDVLIFNEVAAPEMPRLRASKTLKWVLHISDSPERWSEVTCVDGAVRNIGKPSYYPYPTLKTGFSQRT